MGHVAAARSQKVSRGSREAGSTRGRPGLRGHASRRAACLLAFTVGPVRPSHRERSSTASGQAGEGGADGVCPGGDTGVALDCWRTMSPLATRAIPHTSGSAKAITVVIGQAIAMIAEGDSTSSG